jgi:membrane protease YdiL (CAAX protease family)
VFFFFLAFSLKSANTEWLHAIVFALQLTLYSLWSKVWRYSSIQATRETMHPKKLLLGLAFGFLFIGVVFYRELLNWSPNSLPSYIGSGLFFYFAILAFFEEVVFRGTIFAALQKYNAAIAIGATAIVFTLFHFADPRIGQYVGFRAVYIGTIGISLGLLRYFTKSIYPGFLAHFLINGFLAT